MTELRRRRVAGDISIGPRDPFHRRMEANAKLLAPSGRRVARFIDQNRLAVLVNSAAELATLIGTSDATVVRTVQALGFNGLDDLRHVLMVAIEGRATPSDNLRRTLVDVGVNAGRAIDLVLNTHQDALTVLKSQVTRARIADAAALLHQVQRIHVFGIGPSAALARYTAMLLFRTGRIARALNLTGSGLADQMLDLRPGDGLLALAYTHAYREVVAVFKEARRFAMPTVLVTDLSSGKLAQLANIIIAVPRGQSKRVALHGGTLVALEALIVALATSATDSALAAVERLNELRASVIGKHSDI